MLFILLLYLYTIIVKCILGSEDRLLQNLFQNYDKRVRPNANTRKILKMQAKVTVAMLIEIKANEEIASFNIAHYHIWKDPRLVWDPLDYDNITETYVSYSLIWRPQLFIYNGIDIKDLIHDDVQIVQIKNTGEIVFFNQQYVLSICKLNLNRFPFDTQFCGIGQTTAMLPIEIIDVEVLPTPIGHDKLFLGNEEFRMVNVYTRKRNFRDDNHTRFAIEYIFELKRTPTYYATVIIIPAFFTVVLCILGMFSPGTTLGDNVMVGLSTFFALTVLLGIVAEGLPKSSSIPLLTIHILISILICIVAVVVSTLIGFLRDHLADSKKLPPPFLCKIFCVDFKKTLYKLKTPSCLNSIESETIKQPKCPIARCESSESTLKIEDLPTIHSSILTLMKNQEQIKLYLEEIMQILEQEYKNINNLWNRIFKRIDFIIMIFFLFINTFHVFLFSRYAFLAPNQLPKALFHEDV